MTPSEFRGDSLLRSSSYQLFGWAALVAVLLIEFSSGEFSLLGAVIPLSLLAAWSWTSDRRAMKIAGPARVTTDRMPAWIAWWLVAVAAVILAICGRSVFGDLASGDGSTIVFRLVASTFGVAMMGVGAIKRVPIMRLAGATIVIAEFVSMLAVNAVAESPLGEILATAFTVLVLLAAAWRIHNAYLWNFVD